MRPFRGSFSLSPNLSCSAAHYAAIHLAGEQKLKQHFRVKSQGTALIINFYKLLFAKPSECVRSN